MQFYAVMAIVLILAFSSCRRSGGGISILNPLDETAEAALIVDDDNKDQPEASCRGCSLRGACPGLYKGYLDAYGAAELRPVRSPVLQTRAPLAARVPSPVATARAPACCIRPISASSAPARSRVAAASG